MIAQSERDQQPTVSAMHMLHFVSYLYVDNVVVFVFLLKI